MPPSVNYFANPALASPELAYVPAKSTVAERRLAILFAAMLGIAVLFVSGFANHELVHDVAHDARHTFAFPCH